jgi:tryptophan synthase alpha chain
MSSTPSAPPSDAATTRTMADAFARARAEDRAVLIGFLPAGFPDVATSVRAMTAMVEAGVDAVEVGLPYTDPVLDGPVIQAAAQQALENGCRTKEVLGIVGEVAATGAPTLVMTYWNPVLAHGVERFADGMVAAGGAGLITPDLTPDHGADWSAAADARGLDKVFLVAPSSTEERVASTAAACRGFVYATAVMGVTGARATTSGLAGPLVERVRRTTHTPVGVGLGVSNGDQAAEVASYADAVIVGSAFVRCLLDAPDTESGLAALRDVAADLAEGVRRRG